MACLSDALTLVARCADEDAALPEKLRLAKGMPQALLLAGVYAGSASFVWRIGPVGDRVLRLDGAAGVPQRSGEPSVRFLDHCLAIADLHGP